MSANEDGRRKSTTTQQLLAARARTGFGMLEGSFLGAHERFWRLDHLLTKLGPNADRELYRYFPVSAIAALEGHFKQAAAAIVNSGPIYMERGLNLAKDRLKNSLDLIPVLHDKTITVGELVAHWLPFSTLAHIESAIGGLLDLNFKQAAKTAVEPSAGRNALSDQEPIVADVASLWRQIAEAFETRHILAHEVASSFDVTFQMAKDAVDGCSKLATVIEAVIWHTAWKDVPLTQYEMNAVEEEKSRASRQRLAALMRTARRVATRAKRGSMLRRNHFAWRQTTRELVEMSTSEFTGGSIFPMLVSSGFHIATTARCQAIEEWVSLADPEGSRI